MASALAKVQLGISITAADNASDAIRKTQGSLGGLQKTAEETSKAGEKFSEVGESAASGLGKVARLGRPLASFAEGASGEVRELSHGLHGLDLLLTLLPGPIGLAVGAVGGLAAGMFLLNRHMEQSAAKMELLVGPDARALADNLGFSADEAVKLSKAISDLGEHAVLPTAEMLREVKENAERLGIEPAEAVIKFMAAWKGGAEEIEKVQQEIGKLSFHVMSAAEVAKSLRLDPEEIGLEKSVTTADKLKQKLTEIGKETADLESVEKSLTEAQERLKSARWQTYEKDKEAVAQLTQQRDILTSEVAASKMLALANAEIIDQQRGITELEKYRQNIGQALENQAGLARTKDLATGLKLQAILEQRELIDRQINAVEALRVVIGDKDADAQRVALLLAKQQLDVKQKGIVDTDHSEKKAKAAAAQQNHLAALEAEAAAVMHLAKAEADAAVGTAAEHGLKIKLIDAEEHAAIEASKKVHMAKAGHEAAEKAAHIEAEAKKTALVVDDEQKLLQLNQQRLDAEEGRDKARAQTIAERLRSQGREDEAIAAELAQAHVDASAAILKAEHEVEVARVKRHENEKAFAEIEATANAKKIVATEALAQAEIKASQATRSLHDQDVDAALKGLEGVAERLSAIGANGNLAAAAVGQSVASMTKGLGALGKIADDDAQKLGKTVEAVGNAAAGVANAIINAANARLLSQLDIEEQGALKTAKSEQEKAAITEKYEKKKADARDAAQRQSAGISAAVAAAQAIAYWWTPGMQAAAIGQGVAAGAFLAIAGGAAGSSYVPGAATAGMGGDTGGGFNSAGATGSSGAVGNGQAVTIVNNYNQPLVTQQQIGKGCSDSLRSLRNTGADRSRGA